MTKNRLLNLCIKLTYPICNLIVMFVNLFIRRNKKILLFGADNGKRYGGNSRFLYQYLHENKEKYNLTHVIWVTRSSKIYSDLVNEGYETYMMYSIKSLYYHIIAGAVFYVRDAATAYYCEYSKKNYSDLLGLFTLGAKHVYLNHALGIRFIYEDCVNKEERVQAILMKTLLANRFLSHYILNPGGTDEYLRIFVTEEDSKRAYAKETNIKSKYISVGFPELCPCLRYTKHEKEFLNKIHNMKKDKIILYLPLYRPTKETEYDNPLNNLDFQLFLKKNNYLWIDKLHSLADSSMKASFYDEQYAVNLNSEFDINILLSEIDMIVSDYSSSVVKGVYFSIPIVLYMPDYDYFARNREAMGGGINDEMFLNLPACSANSISELINCVNEGFQTKKNELKESYKTAMEVFFDGKRSSYEEISEKIFEYINMKS